jgi:hypothetical protein
MSWPLIVCELHLNLVIEFNVASGDLVVYLLQFFEKPAIGGGLDDFGFNSHLLSPQTLESQLNLLSGCFDPCRMPIQYGLRIGRLGESDLLSGGPFLGSFIAILGTNLCSHFLH